MKIKTIAIIGSGQMGHGIAEVFAINDFQVHLEDMSKNILGESISIITKSLEKLSAKGVLGEKSVEDVLQRITTHTDLEEAVKDADLVIEAIPEIMSLKTKLFQDLERFTQPDTILTSNTSNIMITDIAKTLQKRNRVAGLHFFNPAVMMKPVEVIKGDETSDTIIQDLIDLCKKIGKVPIKVAKDSPGFIVNRIIAPETLFFGLLIERSIASPMEVDAFARLQGLPMGPYELIYFIGVDVVHHSFEYYSETLSPEYGKCSTYRNLFEKKMIGKKTGRGFYDWSNGKPVINTKYSTDKITIMDIFAIEINEAIKLIEDGVGSADDIETAVKLGLNRPFGPISVAKSLTNVEVKNKLEELQKKFDCSVFEPAQTIKKGQMREAVEGRLKNEQSKITEVKSTKPTESVEYNTIIVEKLNGKVARIMLNRPRHNTITGELLDDLERAIDSLWDDKDVNVILITGKGYTFSTGAELSQFIPGGFQFLEFSRKGQRVFRKLSEVPKLTIASLKGYALGGGFELALACDLRVGTDDVTIGLPEVTLGLIPAWGGSQRLVKLIGMGRAMELALTGVKISGKEGYHLGILNKIFKDVDNESLEYSRSIAESTAPISMALTKRLVNKGGEVPMDIGLEMESFAAGVVFGTEDLKEGISSFFQKKKPEYKGK